MMTGLVVSAAAMMSASALSRVPMPLRGSVTPPSLARARSLVLIADEPEPDLLSLVADAEAFLEAEGIGEDMADAPTASQREKQRPKKRRPREAKPVKPSKASKLRVGCYGCGAELQTSEPAGAGYVEPERYELKKAHRQLRLLLCRRCRALTHGEILPAVVEGRLRTATLEDEALGSSPLSEADDGASDETRGVGIGVTTPEQLRAELAPLRDLKVLTVLLVDVTDVTGTFLPRVRDLIGGNPIILVGTKVDLLPKGTQPEQVLSWLYDRLSPRLNVIDAHLVSARTGAGVAAASQAILRERKGRDTFVLGAANVGKSLFVGSFIEHALGGRGKRLPISSATPGTTLRLIGIDCFGGGSMLFDTPGLHLPHRLSAQLLPSELRAILPRGRIAPYTPKVERPLPGTSFFWGGLVRVDVLQAPLCARLSFVSAYALRVSQLEEGEDADAHYASAVGRTLTPPLTVESATELGTLEMRKRVEVDLHEMQQAADISVSGLGWISVGALASLRRGGESDGSMRAVLEVWVPRGVQVSVRPPMPITGLPVPPPEVDEDTAAGGLLDERPM